MCAGKIVNVQKGILSEDMSHKLHSTPSFHNNYEVESWASSTIHIHAGVPKDHFNVWRREFSRLRSTCSLVPSFEMNKEERNGKRKSIEMGERMLVSCPDLYLPLPPKSTRLSHHQLRSFHSSKEKLEW